MKDTFYVVECRESNVNLPGLFYKFATIAEIEELIEGFSEGWEFTIYGLCYRKKK